MIPEIQHSIVRCRLSVSSHIGRAVATSTLSCESKTRRLGRQIIGPLEISNIPGIVLRLGNLASTHQIEA